MASFDPPPWGFVAVDIETTGLDSNAKHSHVLEIGILVANNDFEVVGSFHALAPLRAVNAFVEASATDEDAHLALLMHRESGLLTQLYQEGGVKGWVIHRTLGPPGARPELANREVYHFCKSRPWEFAADWLRVTLAELTGVAPDEVDCSRPMVGASVHFERRWIALAEDGERFLEMFGHRNLDVSAIAEFARLQGHPEPPLRPHLVRHRAVDDAWTALYALQYWSDVLKVKG